MSNALDSDIIFVPTVLVHHLLGWWALINGSLRRSKATVLLFFPNTPVRINPSSGKGFLPKDPTARLFGWLIRDLSQAVAEGRLILGAETEPMRKALEEATGVKFRYLPHPVPCFAASDSSERPLTMSVFGPARHEKGSDILQQAIELYLKLFPETRTRFVIQWLEDFRDSRGQWIEKSRILRADARVEYVTSYFQPGEYAGWLGKADVLLLPYRASSYDLRVSRVVIEAMVHGIPVIATAGTTLAEQAEARGACVTCEDGSSASVAGAIEKAEKNFRILRERAEVQMTSARAHFSVASFRALLTQPSLRRTKYDQEERNGGAGPQPPVGGSSAH